MIQIQLARSTAHCATPQGNGLPTDAKVIGVVVILLGVVFIADGVLSTFSIIEMFRGGR